MAKRRLPLLPDDSLMYLLGSRYCETDRLSQIAWDMFGSIAPGWGRVQAICDFVHDHIRFDYQKARATRTAYEAWQERRRRLPRLRASGHRLLPLHEHSGPLRERLSRRHRRAGHRPDGLQRLDRGVSRTVAGTPSIRATTCPRIGRIVVAYGRDAADVPLIHSFGPHVLEKFQIWTDRIDPPASA